MSDNVGGLDTAAFVEAVKAKRAENINTYRTTTNRFIADYNSEKSIKDDYKGRQLLELLQNADDAKASRVRIEKNTESRTIKICNTGDAFSVAGFGALMLAYCGTKSAGKKDFIGNKGLGFRSILNWADSVDVKSNGCWVHFSRETAYNVAKQELADCWNLIQQQIDSKGLVQDKIAPTLSLPEIKSCLQNSEGWITEITIHYDSRPKTEEDISNQINFITSKTLLFVRNIRFLEIVGFGHNRCFSSSVLHNDAYDEINIVEKTIGGEQTHKYRLFKNEGIVPENIQKKEQGADLTRDPMYYEVCLAIDGEIGNKEYLYSYFKTNIEIGLPCIIHAAFRLDSSRKYLIEDSVINEFLIDKVLEEFEIVAKYLCKTEDKSWRAYTLTLLEQKPDSSKEYLNQLYDGLEKLRNSLSIFPCVDGVYRELSDVRYYGDEFSSFIEENYKDDFPEMLCATHGVCKEEVNAYDENTIWFELEEICKRELSAEQRVGLLKALANSDVVSKIPNLEKDSRKSSEKIHKLPILLDDDGKIIDPNCSIYTAPERELKVPKFTNISYISKNMYDLLKDAFPVSVTHLEDSNQDAVDPGTNNQARYICKCINHYVYVKSYDVAALIPEIIGRTNDLIKKYKEAKRDDDAKRVVFLSVRALYNNYRESGRISVGSENKYAGLQLLARDGSIRNASSLYLSKSYKSGKITEEFYGGIIKEYEYVEAREFYKIANPTGQVDGFEDFLVLCGVSRFLKYDASYCLDGPNVEAVDIDYLNDCLTCDKYRDYKKKPNKPVCKLMAVDKLNKLDLTHLLVLFCKENRIFDEIIKGSRLVFAQEHAQGQYDEHIETSLVAYQMRSRFAGVVSEKNDSEISFLLNSSGKVDYELLHKYDVEYEANRLLQKLGSKKSFQDLSSSTLYGILRSVEENKDRYPNGRRIPTIYGEVYDILKTQPLCDHGELNLACKINDHVEFRKNAEVYYSDDAVLPKTVLNNFPILLLRQRAGVDQVVKYFGVKKLDVSSLKIDKEQIDEDESRSQEFNDYYKERTPYIVMHRIRKVNKNIAEEARRANIVFHILKKGRYFFDGTPHNLNEYEFIMLDRNAYICVSDISVQNLVHEKKFLEAYSEILGIAFALESSELKKIFKTILRDDITTLKADAEEEQDDFEKALEALGLFESKEMEFWNKILRKKEIPIYKSIQGKSLEKYIQESLEFEFPSYYKNVDFDRFDDEDSFAFSKEIHERIGLDFEEFLPKEGFILYHREKMKNCANSYCKLFECLLWKNLNEKDEDSKKTFCKNCFDYENLVNHLNLDEYKYESAVDYENLLKKEVQESFDVDLNQEECKEYKGILYEKFKDGNDTSLSLEDRSLLYFEGYNDKFDKIEEDTEEEEPEDEPQKIVGEIGVIKPVVKNRKERSDKNWNNSEKEKTVKKKAGKKAQDTVMQYLKEKYGEANRRLRSSESNDPGKSDGAHYDILYCEGNPKDPNTVWRYLEVKNASSDTFYMSEAEANFGCKPENQKKYDLALVKDHKVQIVKSFFKDMTVQDFEAQYKPQIHRDFYVSFEFEAQEESDS